MSSFLQLLGLDAADLPQPPVDDWGQHILLGISLPELPEMRLARAEALISIPEHQELTFPIEEEAHSETETIGEGANMHPTDDIVTGMDSQLSRRGSESHSVALDASADPLSAGTDAVADSSDSDEDYTARAKHRWPRHRRLHSISATSGSDSEGSSFGFSGEMPRNPAVMEFGQERAPWRSAAVDALARDMSKSELARMVRAQHLRRSYIKRNAATKSSLAAAALSPRRSDRAPLLSPRASVTPTAQLSRRESVPVPVLDKAAIKAWKLPRTQEKQLETRLEVLVHREEETSDTASFGQIAALMGLAMTVAQVVMGLFGGLLIEGCGSIRGVLTLSAVLVALVQGVILSVDLRYWDRDENVARGVAARRRERRLRAQAAKLALEKGKKHGDGVETTGGAPVAA